MIDTELSLKKVNWKNVFTLFGIIIFVVGVFAIGIISNYQTYSNLSNAAGLNGILQPPTPTLICTDNGGCITPIPTTEPLSFQVKEIITLSNGGPGTISGNKQINSQSPIVSQYLISVTNQLSNQIQLKHLDFPSLKNPQQIYRLNLSNQQLEANNPFSIAVPCTSTNQFDRALLYYADNGSSPAPKTATVSCNQVSNILIQDDVQPGQLGFQISNANISTIDTRPCTQQNIKWLSFSWENSVGQTGSETLRLPPHFDNGLVIDPIHSYEVYLNQPLFNVPEWVSYTTYTYVHSILRTETSTFYRILWGQERTKVYSTTDYPYPVPNPTNQPCPSNTPTPVPYIPTYTPAPQPSVPINSPTPPITYGPSPSLTPLPSPPAPSNFYPSPTRTPVLTVPSGHCLPVLNASYCTFIGGSGSCVQNSSGRYFFCNGASPPNSCQGSPYFNYFGSVMNNCGGTVNTACEPYDVSNTCTSVSGYGDCTPCNHYTP